MNKAQPATIFNEMIGKLDHFYLNDSHSLPPDSLVYRRMVRDCELLKQADPCEGWIAHGLSELLIGNKKGFQSCFDHAMRIAGKMIENCQLMYAQGLRRCGRDDEALRIFQMYAEPERGAVGQWAKVGYWIGAFNTLANIDKRALEMKLKFSSDVDFSRVHRIASILRDSDVSDEDVAEYLDCAEKPIYRRGLIEKSYDARVIDLDGECVVLLTLFVGTDGTTLADMTSELAETIAALPKMHSTLHVSYRQA